MRSSKNIHEIVEKLEHLHGELGASAISLEQALQIAAEARKLHQKYRDGSSGGQFDVKIWRREKDGKVQTEDFDWQALDVGGDV